MSNVPELGLNAPNDALNVRFSGPAATNGVISALRMTSRAALSVSERATVLV
jgi:hypothetical protein